MRVLTLTTVKDINRELSLIGVDPKAYSIFLNKINSLVIKFYDLPIGTCNTLKQTALSLGADCAQNFGVITGKKKKSDVILIGNLRQLQRIKERLKEQPLGARSLIEKIEELLANYFKDNFDLRIRGKTYSLSQRTHIMGILNITPDSFSDGGRFFTLDAAIKRAVEIEEAGADFIDIGAESTRPGSQPISVREELNRLLPVLKAIKKRTELPISIDTYKSQVAREVLSNGADMINDISGLHFDFKMSEVIAEFKVPCIIMHIKGRPKTMQKNPYYDDLVGEIFSYLEKGLAIAQKGGISSEKTIIDPGIGFGKRLEDNYEILRRLKELKSLGRPILVGPSRKSFIGLTLNLPVEERLEGSLAASVLAITQGANILRVHDVKETKRVAVLTDKILGK